jgi:hypothetical protein
MSSTDRLLMSLQAYQETQSALLSPEQTAVFLEPDPFRFIPQPAGCLPLGLDDEGRPVSLDLFVPAYGPLLVAGGRLSGKTSFLRRLADAAGAALDIQFGALTSFPEEWRSQETSPACLGVFPLDHPASLGFLERLVSWADVLPRTRQVILLLVDNLDLMRTSPLAIQPFRWLLEHGPAHRVWPIVTHDPRHTGWMTTLQPYFHGFVLGHLPDVDTSRVLPSAPPMDLSRLQPGRQFYLLAPDRRVRFSIKHQEGA